MPDGILRHRRLPLIDASKQRLRIKSDDLLQLPANNLQNFGFTTLQNFLVPRAPQKTANNRPIFRRTMRKLIVHKRRRQHAVSRAARHQKSETRRKRTPHLLVVSQCHRHRRTVRDIAEIASQTSIRRFQHRSRGVRRSRDNDGVKLITLISRRNRPAIILANYRPHWSRCLERRRIQSRHHRVDHRLHAIFERSKERPRRTLRRPTHFLSRRQHGASQTAVFRFHLRESRQHRAHA